MTTPEPAMPLQALAQALRRAAKFNQDAEFLGAMVFPNLLTCV